MKKRIIRIGTRRSRLALWQAEWVARALEEHHPDLDVERVPIRTLGDRDRATSLGDLGRQGVFTKEIEDALLDRRCDVAVHSLKDLPTRIPAGLTLGAVMRRADPRDALLSRSGLGLLQLPAGSVLGTSSLRRRSQILRLRPDLVVREIRGNVPTRLRAVGVRLEDGPLPSTGAVDATVLAHAGLERLGLEKHVTEILSTDQMVPAPGQGAVAVEIRDNDPEIARPLAPLDHEPTRLATDAEREFLHALGGWCHIPVGALGLAENGEIHLEGIVAGLDGTRSVRGQLSGKDPRALGQQLAMDLRDRGAGEILDEIIALREEHPEDNDVNEEETE